MDLAELTNRSMIVRVEETKLYVLYCMINSTQF